MARPPDTDAVEQELVPINPWQPGDVVDPTRGMIPPEQFGQLQQHVAAMTADPRVLTQLASFGAAALQPRAWGQSPAAHLASAVGYAGEAGDRYTAQKMAEEEQRSKQSKRGEAASRAEERTKAAEDRLALQREKFEFGKGVEERKAGEKLTLLELRARHDHTVAQAKINERNAKNAMYQRPLEPNLPPVEETLARMGLGGRGAPAGGGTAAAGGGGGYPTPTPAAVQHLKSGQGTASQFDEIYGPGAAARAGGG